MDAGSTIRFFTKAAADNAQWKWYAIVDSAQARQLPIAMLDGGEQVRCLLGANQGTPLAEKSPHLVSLTVPNETSAAWQWLDMNAIRVPGVTVLASLMDFDIIFSHLRKFTEIHLPDGDMMIFAFWDPAILGTLIGQKDDLTLHVPGPLLAEKQCSVMFEHIQGWWYWDRDGGRHLCVVLSALAEDVTLPLQLTHAQVDSLVEASVPDHVLYFLDLNQPLLLTKVPMPQRYAFISSAIQAGRGIGLEGMQDLVNYVCAALIYQDRLRQDSQIVQLLDAVKQGKLSFATALAEMPD